MKKINRILSLLLILCLVASVAFASPPEERTLYDPNGIVAVLLPSPFVVLSKEELQDIINQEANDPQEEIDPEIMDTYRTAAESGMLDAGCGVNGEQTVYLASVESTGFTQRMIGLVRSTLDQTYFEAYAASGATDISSDVIKRGGNTWYILNYSLTGTVGTVAITWINGYQIMLSCANITDISLRYMMDQISVL